MAEADWKYLQYNIETGQKRTGDGPSGGASSLSDLDDTSISNPSDGQILGYDGTAGKWKNVAAPAGSVTDVTLDGNTVVNGQGVAVLTTPNVNDLKDTNISNPSSGQTLQYNATNQKWENTTPASGGNVDDVKVNGTSVVTNKVANITSYKEVTQAQYEALPDTKLSDGVLYAIKDGGEGIEGYPPLIYSDEEREIGVWRDGKPLYQKTYVYSPDSTDYTIDISGLNIENIVAGFGFWTRSASNDITQYPIQGRNETPSYNNYDINIRYTPEKRLRTIITGYSLSEVANIRYTIQYTKTTDTPGSGTWNQQGAIAHHYSTTEKVIGTWIDGKPLYEQAFSKTLSGSPDSGGDSFIIAENITYIDTLVNMSGTVKKSNFYAFCSETGLIPTVGWSYSFHLKSNGQLVAWTSNNSSCYSEIAGGKAIAILQYTKTTD